MPAEFTPVESALGGLLVGVASASLLACHGRVAGVSGICAGLLRGRELAWRALFLGGLALGNAAHVALVARPRGALQPLPALSARRSATAGLAVGAGARLAGGCTSGHGVCGISRGAARSVAAMALFVAAGALTLLVAPSLRLASDALDDARVAPLRRDGEHEHALALAALAACSAGLLLTARAAWRAANLLLCGFTFGVGLAVRHARARRRCASAHAGPPARCAHAAAHCARAPAG
jgi:uncharacterized membrane protein YedE/YeeE